MLQQRETTVRNANSAPPGSAGGQTTVTSGQPSGGLPETGPLPRSALSEAVLKTFGGQQPTESNAQGTPAVAPGQAPASQDTPQEGTEETQVQPDNGTPLPDEQAGAPGDVQDANLSEAAETAELPPEEVDPTLLEEQQETQAGGLPLGVQKRIDKLTARLRQLEAQLAGTAEQPAAAAPPAQQPTGPIPLDGVNDPRELDRREETTDVALGMVDSLIARVAVSPQFVEQQLRAQGIRVTNAEGQEDYSTESMVNWLSTARLSFRQVLRDIPKRRKYLADYARDHQVAITAFPWLNQQTDQRHALLHNMLSQVPAMRGFANHEYWLGCALEKHMELQAAAQRRQAGNGHTVPTVRPQQTQQRRVPPRPQPNTAHGPATRLPAKVDKVAAIRAKVKNGTASKADLSELLQATTYAGR